MDSRVGSRITTISHQLMWFGVFLAAVSGIAFLNASLQLWIPAYAAVTGADALGPLLADIQLFDAVLAVLGLVVATLGWFGGTVASRVHASS